MPEECPAEVEAFINRCLHQDPSERPSAKDLVDFLVDLDPGMAPANSPVLQRRSSKASRSAAVPKAPPPTQEVRPDAVAEAAEGPAAGPQHVAPPAPQENGSLAAQEAVVGNGHAGPAPENSQQPSPEVSQKGLGQAAESPFGDSPFKFSQGGAQEAVQEGPGPPIPPVPQKGALKEPESGLRGRADGAADAGGPAEGGTSQKAVSDEQPGAPRTPAMEYADIWKAGFSPFAQQDG